MNDNHPRAERELEQRESERADRQRQLAAEDEQRSDRSGGLPGL
jgi:hypothetical protein